MNPFGLEVRGWATKRRKIAARQTRHSFDRLPSIPDSVIAGKPEVTLGLRRHEERKPLRGRQANDKGTGYIMTLLYLPCLKNIENRPRSRWLRFVIRKWLSILPRVSPRTTYILRRRRLALAKSGREVSLTFKTLALSSLRIAFGLHPAVDRASPNLAVTIGATS